MPDEVMTRVKTVTTTNFPLSGAGIRLLQILEGNPGGLVFSGIWNNAKDRKIVDEFALANNERDDLEHRLQVLTSLVGLGLAIILEKSHLGGGRYQISAAGKEVLRHIREIREVIRKSIPKRPARKSGPQGGVY